MTGNDVGEIRRVLNSFLQFLEQDDSRSLVVAATNHAQSLDSALFRRFDVVVAYDSPSPALAAEALRNRLASFDTTGLDWNEVQAAATGLSYADLAAAADSAAKDAVLDDSITITTDLLVAALSERRRGRRTDRA